MSLGMTEKEMLCALQLLHCCHLWIPHFSLLLNLPRLFSESNKWYLIMFYYIRKMTMRGNSFDFIHASKTSECKQNPVRDQCKVKSSSSLGWSLTRLSYDTMIWERINGRKTSGRRWIQKARQDCICHLTMSHVNLPCLSLDEFSTSNLWNRHLSLI